MAKKKEAKKHSSKKKKESMKKSNFLQFGGALFIGVKGVVWFLLLSTNGLKSSDIYEGKSYAEFKSDLAEVVVNFLKPFQEKYNELKKNPDYVISVLEKSEEKARELTSATLDEVKKKLGMGYWNELNLKYTVLSTKQKN